MESKDFEKEELVSMYYDSLIDSLLNVGKKPCWLVVKDTVKHSFTILGIGFHDLDLSFLYKKLHVHNYQIQVDSPPIVLDNGSEVSFDSVKKCFIDYGYKWENPESLLCRLLKIVKNSNQN